MLKLITPQWPAPANIRAFCTRRQGGVSQGEYAGLNLATHVGDDPARVMDNRRLLAAQLPAEPYWLEQTHSTRIVDANSGEQNADACFTELPDVVCTVMTADCLPLLLCDREGRYVAAVHAGWRGLAEGIIENSVRRFPCQPGQLLAWLGPAIGPGAFEVGEEVRDIFVRQAAEDEQAFVVSGDKYKADLYQLARLRLQRLGISAIYAEDFCTYRQADDFYSYRRDGQTGRIATGIWRQG